MENYSIIEINEKGYKIRWRTSNLEELRKNIDEIDLKILDLIEERKDLVTEVVKLKKSSNFFLKDLPHILLIYFH